MIYPAIILLFGAGLLALVVGLSGGVALKFVFGVLAMLGVSKMLGWALGIKEDFGMLMVRSQAGIGTINKLASYEGLWKLLADLGMAIAYGASSFFIIQRPAKERAVVMLSGLVLLCLLSVAVAPSAFQVLMGILGSGGMATKTEGLSAYAYVFMLIFVAGGLALTAFISLITYTLVIISAMVGTFFFGTSELEQTAPGATLILPGINIPFAEGVVALAVILLVHEFGHAVLARIARVRIVSSGLVLLGVIPVGAFVEPDEEALQKTNRERQGRVLVAGSAANFITAIIAFALFMVFIYASAPYKESGALLVGGELGGQVVHKINGVDAVGFLGNATLKENQTLLLETNGGQVEYSVQKGGLSYYDLDSNLLVCKYANPLLSFIYGSLGLLFSLSFVVGMVNLLPMPFFDGYRLLETGVGRSDVVNALSIVALVAFVINFLPWVL